MPRYSAVGSATNTAATTILYVVSPASTFRRIHLYEVILGSQATPADQAAQYQIRRLTDEDTTPGGAGVTGVPLDIDDSVAISAAVEDPSGEPTYETGALLEIALNQRATFRWVAAPGSEFICTAAEDQGFGIEAVAVTSAYIANATLLWKE